MSMRESRVAVSICHSTGIQPVPLDPDLDIAGRNTATFRRLRKQGVVLAGVGTIGSGAAILHHIVSEPPVPLHLLALSLTVPGMLLATGVITTRSVRWGHALSVMTCMTATGIAVVWLRDTHTHTTDCLTMAVGLVLPALVVLLLCQRLRRARRRLMLKSLF